MINPISKRGRVLAVLLLLTVAACLLCACTEAPVPEESGTEETLPEREYAVPIYRGMSVSSEAPHAEASVPRERLLLSADASIPVLPPFPDLEDAVREHLGLDGRPAEGYFAPKDSDVYITVHLDNPDALEIVSFTVNGVKYSAYMFEDGSDLENIVIKTGVGDADGTVSYTVDAIKYIDGTEIRDVRMDGERTVEVTVTPDGQPAATLRLTPLLGALRVTVTVADPLQMIGKHAPEGILLYLFEGERIVAERRLERGKNTVMLEGLSSDVAYTAAAVAVYDALDGAGVTTHLLATQAASPAVPVTLCGCTVEGDVLSISLSVHEEYRGRIGTELCAIGGEVFFSSWEPVTKIEGFLSDTPYRLSITYEDGGEERVLTHEFTTERFFAVVLETNDGAARTERILTVGAALPTPTRQGYTFGGWYSDAALRLPVSDAPAYSCTLYAHWKEEIAPFRLSYESICIVAEWGVEEGIAVTGLSGTLSEAASVRIPAFIGGESVISIGKEAFAGNTEMEELILPDSVFHIRERAFAECCNLQRLTLPERAYYIERAAFARCPMLEEVRIPDGVRVLSRDLFYQCFSLHSLILPDTLERIEPYALAETALRTLTLPDSMRVVEDDAAFGARIEELSLGNGIQTIGTGAFYGNHMTSLTLPKSLSYIGAGAFSQCDQLVEVICEEGLSVFGAPSTEWEVDDSDLPEAPWDRGIFEYCQSLCRVTLSSSIRVIGARALANCPQLTEVILPEGVETVDRYAFLNCEALSALSLPSTLKTVKDGAFSGTAIPEQDQAATGAPGI